MSLRQIPALCLGILLLTLGSGAVIADPDDNGQNRWYQIELIVFRHLDATAVDSERWPLDPGWPDLAGSIEVMHTLERDDEELLLGFPQAFDSPTRAPVPGDSGSVIKSVEPVAFQLLDATEHALTDAWRLFKRSRYYRPMLHLAWRQPGFDKDDAAQAHIYSLYEKPEANAAAGGIGSPGQTRAHEPGARVDGTVRLSLARYLHIDVDLVLTIPPPPPDPDAVPVFDAAMGMFVDEWDLRPTRFRLQESRRLRSGELHYLDHPIFGILVKVVPYDWVSAVEQRPGRAALIR